VFLLINQDLYANDFDSQLYVAIDCVIHLIGHWTRDTGDMTDEKRRVWKTFHKSTKRKHYGKWWPPQERRTN